MACYLCPTTNKIISVNRISFLQRFHLRSSHQASLPVSVWPDKKPFGSREKKIKLV